MDNLQGTLDFSSRKYYNKIDCESIEIRMCMPVAGGIMAWRPLWKKKHLKNMMK